MKRLSKLSTIHLCSPTLTIVILYGVTAPKHLPTNCKSCKIERHLLVTMFKIFNTDCPTYLWEQFHRTSEIHDYDLQLPLPKTNFLKHSFSYRVAIAWNQLSNDTREMGDLTTSSCKKVETFSRNFTSSS